MVVSQLISSCNIKSCLQNDVHLICPKCTLKLSKTCSHYRVAFIINLKEKKDIRKCNSKVLKTFSYFFFVDALNMKQIISPLFRVRRNRHWFCLVSLVSLKIKPLNLFSVLLWNYLIFENVVSDHEIQIKLNIVRNYLYYSVHDFFWLLSHGHLFHISVFNLLYISLKFIDLLSYEG